MDFTNTAEEVAATQGSIDLREKGIISLPAHYFRRC